MPEPDPEEVQEDLPEVFPSDPESEEEEEPRWGPRFEEFVGSIKTWHRSPRESVTLVGPST